MKNTNEHSIAKALALVSLMFASADQVLALTPDGNNTPKAQIQTNENLANIGVLPMVSKSIPKVYGMTIGNRGQAWWQWALNFTEAENPLLQNGNVDCSAGQSGKVWYLAGSFSGPADRTCTIKHNRAIFFPVINSINWGFPDEASTRTASSAEVDDTTNWTCSIDDVPCVWSAQVVRAQSDVLPLNIPVGSILDTWGYETGIQEISIADGYWVMLDPMPIGLHKVHFSALRANGFTVDITYHLTVK